MRFCHAQRSLLLLNLGVVLAACSVYDSNLLVQSGQSAIERDASAGMVVDSSRIEMSDSSMADEPLVKVAAATGDAYVETRCGDGKMTGAEKCDISIPIGQPGACPKDCPSINDCIPRVLNGTACYVECLLRELVCEGGDQCCPASCTADNDSDCSPKCGDGVVDESSGETCDPRAQDPCKTRDSDCNDGDPCTIDKLVGSAKNCSSACIHMPVTATQAGDDCCPLGGNATTDSDCKPRCGNGVREADEECDGGDGCDAQCKSIGTPEQRACLAASSGSCQTCACTNCTLLEHACRNGLNAVENAKCRAVLDCTQKSNCVGQACFCMDALCLFAGPCRAQIEAAAGTTDPAGLGAALADPTTTVGKSLAADSCRIEQCQDTCR